MTSRAAFDEEDMTERAPGRTVRHVARQASHRVSPMTRYTRIQVKTSTVRTGRTWSVCLSTTAGASRRTYDPEEIDGFFIIDGDLRLFLIPVAAVGGRHVVQIDNYVQYQVGDLGGSWTCADGASPDP